MGLLKRNQPRTKQKGKQLLGVLRAMRFPNLTKWEEDFQKVVDDTQFGKGIRLTHPEGFEEDYYTLTLRWNSLEELDKLLEEVRRRRSVLRKLFKEERKRIL